TVILFEANHRCVWVIALEIENIPNVRAAPAVNRLVLVAHYANVLVPLREQPHQLILSAIGVLILVDHQEFVAPPVLLSQILVVLQQPNRFKQQIVEIERIGLPEAILITLVHHGQPRRFRILRRTVHILRRLLVALGVRYPGAHRPVLHELFVEPDVAEDLPDERDLVVVVVDVELAREAGAHVGETRSIASQHAHAEGVKRRDQRSRAMLRITQQLEDAVAHLARRFVRKRDRQDGRTGHAMRLNQVRDAVSNYPGFAAAGAGQEQQRTLHMRDGRALLGIEADEEVHEKEGLSQFSMDMRRQPRFVVLTRLSPRIHAHRSPARFAARPPIADQSLLPPPSATSSRNASCNTLARGMGVSAVSAAASARRISLSPSFAAKPAGSKRCSRMMPP